MGKWLKGVFAGGVLGFITGILFAPQKGEETRKKLQDAVDQAKKTGQELKNKGEVIINKAKQKLDEVMENEIDQ